MAIKSTLTLEGARKAAEAAVAFANSNGAPGSAIAVVDDGGHLLYFVRLDGTFTGSPNISIGKAKTAALFRRPTGDFESLVNKGRFAMTALPPDFTPLQGGVPIKHGGQVIGAIGVSGAKSAAQDEEVALAGARAIEGNGNAAAGIGVEPGHPTASRETMAARESARF
ncbi:MAG: heme-binding protein [Verrucomicrobia bacterium]|nr:heme-binding protein [Verrucomicrobiota bacterium]